MKKIAVVIPCYNGYRFMDKCLSALEKQTFKNFQVVVVDDCSTDDSFQLLLEYKQHSNLEMVVIRNNQNLHAALARSEGVKNADAEWICFCDCDDWYEVDFFEKMLCKAETTNSDLVMCHFNYAYANGTKEFLSGLNILDDNSTKEEFIALTPMSMCRFIMKKTLFENITIPNIRNAEDGAIVPQLLIKSQRISIIHEGLYNYFIRENSTSTRTDVSIYKDFLTSQEVINKILIPQFTTECEFIGVKNICYGAILNALKAKVKLSIVKQVLIDFEKNFPNWDKNKYICSLSRGKRIFLKMTKLRVWGGLIFFAKVHSFLLKRKAKKQSS